MIEVHPISAFTDNYIWAIIDREQQRCIIVDPGQADPVIQFCQTQQLTIAAILITHHHPDHVGGLRQLKQQHWLSSDQPIYGPKDEAIALVTHPITEPHQLQLFGLEFSVLSVPGHTKGHIAYYGNHWLFCGDTLFSAGCGRLFEGTPKTMLHSLSKFKALPDDTLVFPAHEYTLANLKFALTVEPNNVSLQHYFQQVQQLRQQQRPSLPSTIGQEKQINPFLRVHSTTIQEYLQILPAQDESTYLQTFTQLRQMKDTF